MSAKIKVLLVWPKGYDVAQVMPLSLGYLSSNLDKSRCDIRIVDCSLDGMDSQSPKLRQVLTESDPDVVGVSCWSLVYPEAMAVIRLAKSVKPSVVTIVGGSYPTLSPRKVLENPEVDFVYRGEAELTFQSFLDRLQEPAPDWSAIPGLAFRNAGGEIHAAEPNLVSDLDAVRIPDYDGMRLDDYIEAGYRYSSKVKRNAPIWTTRGCPYQCAFCVAPKISGCRVRKHSVGYLVRWVQHLYRDRGIRWVSIIDDNFTFDTRYATEFCEQVIGLKLKDLGFGTPNGVRMDRGTPELWRLMKRAGWSFVSVAPESGSPRVLKLMKKHIDLERIPGAVKDIKSAGLRVNAFFLVGFPGETEADLMQTRDLIRRCGFDCVYFNIFQPFPGSGAYEDLVAGGKLAGEVKPTNYSDGVPSYRSEELREFNFARFIMGTYFLAILHNPRMLYHLLKHHNLGFVVRKIVVNLKNIFRARGRQAA